MKPPFSRGGWRLEHAVSEGVLRSFRRKQVVEAGYFPCQRGARFSLNAAIPSAASADVSTFLYKG